MGYWQAEVLGDHWGARCASKDLASAWADRLIETVRHTWSAEPGQHNFFKGTVCCLSALVTAQRYDELLAQLELERHQMWHYRLFGVKALEAQGKNAEAIEYAEASRGWTDGVAIARVCDELLLSLGKVDEAYLRYGLEASQGGTFLATFRTVAKKYPHKPAT